MVYNWKCSKILTLTVVPIFVSADYIWYDLCSIEISMKISTWNWNFLWNFKGVLVITLLLLMVAINEDLSASTEHNDLMTMIQFTVQPSQHYESACNTLLLDPLFPYIVNTFYTTYLPFTHLSLFLLVNYLSKFLHGERPGVLFETWLVHIWLVPKPENSCSAIIFDGI